MKADYQKLKEIILDLLTRANRRILNDKNVSPLFFASKDRIKKMCEKGEISHILTYETLRKNEFFNYKQTFERKSLFKVVVTKDVKKKH